MHKFSEVNFVDIDENDKYQELIERVLETAFEIEGLNTLHLYINVILTNPYNIRVTNKKYRNIDKETDVLSFPMFEKKEIEEMKKLKYELEEVLGDIMISVDRVKIQAEEYGHSFNRELAYMIIHGFYHIIGYDHMNEEDKNEMRKKEENVLNNLNITR